MVKCECGIKKVEYEGKLFCPKCDMVPGSWEETFVNLFLDLMKFKTEEGKKQATKHLRELSSLKMADSRCHNMGVDYSPENNVKSILGTLGNAFNDEGE